jgi:hypothetical protein
MADDVLEDAGPAPDAGKAKRAPPTIDLEATKVSEAASTDAKPTEAAPQPDAEIQSEPPKVEAAAPASKPISPWVIAPVSGAVAASLVILVGWLLGWPAVQAPPAAPEVSAAQVDELGKRVAGIETKVAKPAAPVTDPATTARLDTLEKSVTALRGDLANLRTQSDKLAASVSEAKRAPADLGTAATTPAPAVDLSAINERLDQIERTNRAQEAAIAQAGEKAATPAKVQDDMALRRVVAAALLDVAVRHGDHFVRPLAVAKGLAPNADALKPLDEFAEKGVPNPQALCRELLTLVPKLSPAADTSTTGSGIVDRLQAGASKLVRIERTDVVGTDRNAIVARVTAAALRNELPEARRELASLDAANRAPAQAWLDRVAARDAALAASRQFADDSMAALAKPGQ